MEHLVFYDGQCGLCDAIVSRLIVWDKKEVLAFAPLHGKTAKIYLKDFPDTLVLIEDYKGKNPKTYFFGKGALRVFWLLGGFWSVLGLLSFLPTFIVDPPYRFIAKYRHHFFNPSSLVSEENKDRFLD